MAGDLILHGDLHIEATGELDGPCVTVDGRSADQSFASGRSAHLEVLLIDLLEPMAWRVAQGSPETWLFKR